MDDILKVLTNDEKEFIKHHGISPSDIYDARGEIVKVYHDKAKKQLTIKNRHPVLHYMQPVKLRLV